MFLRLASAYSKMSLCRPAIVQPLEHHHAQLLPLLVGRQLGRQLDRLLHQGIKVQRGVLLTREQTCQKMQFCKIKMAKKREASTLRPRVCSLRQ